MPRIDPRAEPVADPRAESVESVDHVAPTSIAASGARLKYGSKKITVDLERETEEDDVPRPLATATRGEIADLSEPGADDAARELAAIASLEAAPRPAPTPSSIQAERLERIEALVKRNDWHAIAAELGPLGDVAHLPPTLGIVAAIAHNEAAKDATPEARALAVVSLADILGMPSDNELVHVIARRLLRKNPVRFRERPAPPPRVTAFIIAGTVVVLGGLAWAATAFLHL